MPGSPMESRPSLDVPLCVDLDGTLILTDVLHESVLRALGRPRLLLRAIASLLKGKAALKAALAESIRLDPEALPYREDLVAFLKEQRGEGRRIILATATHKTIAESVAAHLGIFSGVMATDGSVNLGGRAKRDALVAAFGSGGFDYVGDSAKDWPIFAEARVSHLADPPRSLERRARKSASVGRVFRRGGSRLKTLVKCVRAHQWSKNVLLAVPLVTAHKVFDAGAVVACALAFACFSLQASATYIINDLHDLDVDRKHPRKKSRPLASGAMPIPGGILLALLLSAAAILLSAEFLGLPFLLILLGYTALTLWYSFDLKRRLIVDTIALATLYTVRLLAGAAAISVAVSEWLLMFSLFFFLSLALMKRYIELSQFGQKSLAGRGYLAADAEVLLAVGSASGLLSVLVLALYVTSPTVLVLYRTPQLLWLLCPLMIYWITRAWFLAKRGQVHHDPIVFAVTDVRSYVIALLFAVVLFLATRDFSWVSAI
jgi:4-hydroxybenzoate polyprenyltransferase/phosphoserine phosphatase